MFGQVDVSISFLRTNCNPTHSPNSISNPIKTFKRIVSYYVISSHSSNQNKYAFYTSLNFRRSSFLKCQIIIYLMKIVGQNKSKCRPSACSLLLRGNIFQNRASTKTFEATSFRKCTCTDM